MKHTITIILFLVITGMVHAQTVIHGTVTDEQGKPVDAYITASSKGAANILGFADTDIKGGYRMEIRVQADSLSVTVAGISIASQTKTVANRTQRLDFIVKESTMQLKEVSVRAEKIRRQGIR